MVRSKGLGISAPRGVLLRSRDIPTSKLGGGVGF